MKEITVRKNEAQMRLDKYLEKLLPGAGISFLYKMLRKKNITLNGKKAQGGEHLREQDVIRIFFAEETYEKFRTARSRDDAGAAPQTDAQPRIPALSLRIVYEDEDILAADKPAGLLSQKACAHDQSVNDWLKAYLGGARSTDATGKDPVQQNDCMQSDDRVQIESRLSFTPSAMNRLDRNTSGLVLCAKTYRGARFLSAVLKDRSLHKYYLALVKGCLRKAQDLSAFLVKDAKTNRVTVFHEKPSACASAADEIRTKYEPLAYFKEHDATLVRICLITGKPHQIRAHLSATGHPIAGDPKYGDPTWNRDLKKRFHISRQFLHAYEVHFPTAGESPAAEGMTCAGKTVFCDVPQDLRSLIGNATLSV